MHSRMTPAVPIFIALTAVSTASTASPPSTAEKSQFRPHSRTDFTAYTRPRGRAAVGPLKLELGLVDEVTLGTYVPPWFTFALVGAPAPNFYLKARDWWSGPLTLAVRGGFLYVDGRQLAKLAGVDARGNLMALLSEFDASLRASARVCVSLGIEYTHIAAIGSRAEVTTSIEGASTANTVHARVFGQWQMTRVFSLTLLLRYFGYQGPTRADVSAESSAATIDAHLSGQPAHGRQRFAAVPGVSFDWTRWELSAGIGYGAFPLPALSLPTRRAWPILDLAVAYHFDLYD
jgi:hypothetical protein